MNLHLPTRSIQLLAAALAAVAVSACSAADDTAAEAEEAPTPTVVTESATPRVAYDCQRVSTGRYC